MKKYKDILTIGFALFAMFFGAGNLLLPPFIGLQIGSHIAITILAFGLTGIVLPFFGILSIVQSGNSFHDLGNRIHPKLAPILGSIIMLCIGPLIAIPRTAATTHEIAILPSFPDFNPAWSSILFFVATWALTIVPSKVVDIIGNFFTPLLLLLLLALIILGIVHPQADYSLSSLNSLESFSLGFTEGYQTLDVFASVIFAGIIINAAKSKGYTTIKEKNKVVITSGIVSASCLFLIYGGLVYLGATSGVTNMEIPRSSLLIQIAQQILGKYGMLGIALSIGLACLTTAIAVTSAVGTFFSELSGDRLSYKLIVTVCCILSAAFAVKGVDSIIQFAYPPLAFAYPIVITLVLYIVLFGRFIKVKAPYIGALLASTAIATLSLGKVLGLWSTEFLTIWNKIPFFDIDLGWVLPSVIGFLVGYIISLTTSKQNTPSKS
ncbi:branched-chain amino acid transport system II carrier protein [Sphingobacterium tabacisoli]|uniref:Branched-chain amino acid transport system II carrier protein n=1 Tax=Sphingobacterium tabacisoli TaxID=2044855 RepID=A0ABW5KYB4_9SPHI|nr:branched-chain amino acid transport system II carrier protein [Sphingobacterium tabacisoli]